MKVSFWAEVRRLHEVEGRSRRAIATKLRCARKTVDRALDMPQPPDEGVGTKRGSILDPYKEKIDALVATSANLSAVRVTEEIRKGPEGYRGSVILVRRYLRTIRPARGRIYQEVVYEPGQAMQVDWGHCGRVEIDGTSRKVSVLVAVLCYSRLCYIEFTLSQRKAEFYRAIRHALEFYGGSPRQIIFDNLKAAVLNGSGRNACLHPEFLALCGHYYLEPIACQRRDPESKGMDLLLRAAGLCADLADVYWLLIGPVMDRRVARLARRSPVRERLLGFRADAAALVSGRTCSLCRRGARRSAERCWRPWRSASARW